MPEAVTVPSRGPVLSRRGVAIALPAAVALTGCRWGPESDAADQIVPGTTPPPPDADRVIVEEAIHAIGAKAAMVSVAAATKPALAKRLAGFATLHEAHLRHLDAADGEPPDGARARGLTGVLDAERELQDQLIGLAARSGSGILARSLASMSAGVAQHLALAAGAER